MVFKITLNYSNLDRYNDNLYEHFSNALHQIPFQYNNEAEKRWIDCQNTVQTTLA